MYAEDVLITQSLSLKEKITVDGKYSVFDEWKKSSQNYIEYDDGTRLIIRSAHDTENFYFMLNLPSDTVGARGLDFGIICLDVKNNKSITPDKDDYCFYVMLDGKSQSLQGGAPFKATKNFETITIEHYSASGTMSDENDRYTPIPHTGYEFVIPISELGYSDNYGMYVHVFDYNEGKIYSWPKNLELDSFMDVPSPSLWGNMISPDKTIPEFEIPMIILLSSLFFVIWRTRLFTRMSLVIKK